MGHKSNILTRQFCVSILKAEVCFFVCFDFEKGAGRDSYTGYKLAFLKKL